MTRVFQSTGNGDGGASCEADEGADMPNDRSRRCLCSALHCRRVLKVVKQTVMTSVYGVTFVGARKQIQSVLGDKMVKKTEASGVRICLGVL